MPTIPVPSGKPNEKPFELAVLFLRLFRALDAIVGGDAAAARAWLHSHGAVPSSAVCGGLGLRTGLIHVGGQRQLTGGYAG